MSWKQETRMYLAEKLIHWAFIIAPHNYEGLRLKLHIGEYAERMYKKLNQNKDMNTEETTEKKSNLLYTLLGVVLIWIGVIAIGVFWAWVFDGEQFLIRNVLLFPFTMVGLYATRWTWQYYR